MLPTQEERLRIAQRLNHIGASICIPACHAQDTLPATLKAIANQSYPPLEIIIAIDNCRPTLQAAIDNTPQEIQGITRLIYLPIKAGCYRARNTAALLAKQPVLIPCDADDIPLSNHLEILIGILNNKRIVRSLLYNLDRPHNILPAVSQIAIHRENFINIGGYIDYICGADKEFLNRAARTMTIKRATQPTYIRIPRHNSLTKHPDTKMGSDIRSRVQQDRTDKMYSGYKQLEIPIAEFKDRTPWEYIGSTVEQQLRITKVTIDEQQWIEESLQ